MSNMTAHELQAWLRSQFPKEDERNEWKEWRSLKHHVSGQQGDDVISYVAAISNMEGGALVRHLANQAGGLSCLNLVS